MKRKYKKIITKIILVAIILSTLFSSCSKNQNNQNKNSKEKRNTSGELVYVEFDPENIMLLNNETVYIKDVDKSFKFPFYSEREYENVSLYDSAENSFNNKVVHYDKNYNFNMYYIDFVNGEYIEGMNYTIELPYTNDFFLIKDIEKTNQITFTIKTAQHDSAKYSNDLNFDNTYSSVEDIKELKDDEIALVEDESGITPYILSEDGESIVKAKFSDVYKAVDIYSKGSVSIEDNKELLYERIKNAIVNSGFYRSIVMTTYAEDISEDVGSNIDIKLENFGGDTKVSTTVNISEDHSLTITCIFNIDYESNIKISDTTNIEETLDFDNIDFAVTLTIKEFSIKDVLSKSGELKVEDASKLISNEDKQNFLKALDLSDKEIQSSKNDLLSPIRIPLGCGFFIKCQVPFDSAFNYDGTLATTLNMPCHAKPGFRFNKQLKSFLPYQEYNYSVDFSVEGEIKIKSHVGVGLKATLYALNEDLLSVNAGAVVKLHNDDEFAGNLKVNKTSKDTETTASFDFTGHIKVYLTIDIYGGALISTKPIPIIGQLIGYEINPKFEKEIYNKTIFEKEINYVVATISEMKDISKTKFYSYAINEDTVVVTKYSPDDERFKELRKNRNIVENGILTECSSIKDNKRYEKRTRKIIFIDPIEVSRAAPLFNNFYELEEIVNLKYVFSDKLDDLSYMFDRTNLVEIDFSGCDFSNIKKMNDMFADSKKLKKVNMSNLDLRNVFTTQYMFLNCDKLEEVNFSGCQTENLVNMGQMFRGCAKIEKIDLSSLDISKVYFWKNNYNSGDSSFYMAPGLGDGKNYRSQGMSGMFDGCVELKTIYVSNEPDVDMLVDKASFFGGSMFSGCDKLVGGNGSTLAKLKEKYDKYQDFHFAVIDNELHEGLFTKK